MNVNKILDGIGEIWSDSELDEVDGPDLYELAHTLDDLQTWIITHSVSEYDKSKLIDFGWGINVK